MNDHRCHETVTLRMSPRLLAEIQKATEKLKLTNMMRVLPHEDYSPTRSATIRFLIQVGINYLKECPCDAPPRMAEK